MADKDKGARNANGKSPNEGKKPKTLRQRSGQAFVVTLLAAYIAFSVLGGSRETEPSTPISEIIALAENGEVLTAELSDRLLAVTVTLNDEDETSLTATYSSSYTESLINLLVASGAEVTSVSTPRPGPVASLISGILPILLIFGLLLLILRRGTLGNLGKLGKRGTPVETPETTFKDVAGCDEAIDDLKDIVDTLKNPEKYKTLGAKTPRGYLLAGPPGTGKTLLAKAVAGEAGVPFFAVSGAEFVEVFVGQGAGRVRDLFTKARKHPAAIVFIDEIDAVGRTRTTTGATGANVETENTLNQLLGEMDGFDSSSIVVLAATNRPDMLDKALTRAGRFDRTIVVPAPDRAGREALLKMYLEKHPTALDIDLTQLAARTIGMTGADIANLANRAALDAAREGREKIEETDIEQALATLMLGRERKSAVMTERDRKVTAWHEAGHAAAALLLDEAADPVVVSIVPRGPAGGVTWMKGSENLMPTRAELRAQLVVSLAGRAGEQVGLDGECTPGAHNDLQVATDLADKMITQWGMGRESLGVKEDRLFDRRYIDEQVDQMLDDALSSAEHLLDDNLPLVEALVEALLAGETVGKDELGLIRENYLRRSADGKSAEL